MDDQSTETYCELLHPAFSRYSPWPSSFLKSFSIYSYLSRFAAFLCISSICPVFPLQISLLYLSLLLSSFFTASPCLSVAVPDKCSSYTLPSPWIHSPFLLKVTTLFFAPHDAESLSARLLSPVWQENRVGGRSMLLYTHLAKRMRGLRGGCLDLGLR